MIHQVLCHDLCHYLGVLVSSLPAVIHQGEGEGFFDVFGFGFFHGGKIAVEQTENKRNAQWVRALARASRDSTARLSGSHPAQAHDSMVASKPRYTYFSSASLTNGSCPS